MRQHRYWLLRTAGFSRRQARHISISANLTVSSIMLKMYSDKEYMRDYVYSLVVRI